MSPPRPRALARIPCQPPQPNARAARQVRHVRPSSTPASEPQESRSARSALPVGITFMTRLVDLGRMQTSRLPRYDQSGQISLRPPDHRAFRNERILTILKVGTRNLLTVADCHPSSSTSLPGPPRRRVLSMGLRHPPSTVRQWQLRLRRVARGRHSR